VRIVVLIAAACLIFGAGSVLGAASDFLDKAQDVTHDVKTATAAGCERPDKVIDVGFSKTKYAHVAAHARRAIREGWPEVLVLNRKGTDQRRDRALEGVPTKPGYDRDEYPPAVGRKSWRTNVALVPKSENRSHGSVMGTKLNHSPSGRPYCDGSRFRYVWY
jgi:hypothetical protein